MNSRSPSTLVVTFISAADLRPICGSDAREIDGEFGRIQNCKSIFQDFFSFQDSANTTVNMADDNLEVGAEQGQEEEMQVDEAEDSTIQRRGRGFARGDTTRNAKFGASSSAPGPAQAVRCMSLYATFLVFWWILIVLLSC
jgi:hypothetical protein